jgi:hypothetical protein
MNDLYKVSLDITSILFFNETYSNSKRQDEVKKKLIELLDELSKNYYKLNALTKNTRTIFNINWFSHIKINNEELINKLYAVDYRIYKYIDNHPNRTQIKYNNLKKNMFKLQILSLIRRLVKDKSNKDILEKLVETISNNLGIITFASATQVIPQPNLSSTSSIQL